MANKTVSNPSLANTLAKVGVKASPGVSSGGNVGAQRAAAFKAGVTYTPSNSGAVRAQQGPNQAGVSHASGPGAMRTVSGPGGRVGIAPIASNASRGQPFAPSGQAGRMSPARPGLPGPSQSFLPPSFGGGGGAPQAAGPSLYGQAQGAVAGALGALGDNFGGFGGGPQSQAPGVNPATRPMFSGAPTDFASQDSQRWGAAAATQAPTDAGNTQWIGSVLWSMYQASRAMNGGK